MAFNNHISPVEDCVPKRRKISGKSEKGAPPCFFNGVNAFILAAGIGSVRTNLFKCKIVEFGGMVSDNLGTMGDESRLTHLIVDDGMTSDRILRILKVAHVSELHVVRVVRSAWLSECIKIKQLAKVDDYEIHFPIGASSGSVMPKKNSQSDMEHQVTHNLCIVNENAKNVVVSHKDISDHDRDYQHSCSEDECQSVEPSNCGGVNLSEMGKWVCAHSSTTQQKNLNHHITDKLEAMAKTYESINDKWRALGYQKAIIALKKQKKAITSFEEAKSIRGIGARLAEKIWEIAESGELQKLNELTSQDEMKALELFTNVWGAGAHTARAWVQRGYRSLDDLKADDAGLTRNQRIGLKYYDEFLERMPRSEAAQIEAVVQEMALSIKAGLIVMACGSYRRGKQTCGDVDILITHPDGHSHCGVYSELINRLTGTGFLTDNLVSVENNGEHKKYLGVCQLPSPNSKHRRLDLIVVPFNEFACASLYFTGSAHLNRSMRNLASRLNMSLNEHALYSGVVRTKGVKVSRGVPLPTPTEESVFTILGLPYLPPEERDH